MLSKFLYFIFFIIFMQVSIYAVNFDPALTGSLETILAVRKAIVKPFSIDTLNAGKIIISVNYPGNLDCTIEGAPQRLNLTSVRDKHQVLRAE